MRLLLLICMVTFSTVSVAKKPLDSSMIDKKWIKVILERDLDYKKDCSSVKLYLKKLECKKSITEAYKSKGDWRGTEAYIVKRYRNIDNSGLKTLISERQALLKKSRSNIDIGFSENYEVGEITSNDLFFEIEALKSLLQNKSPKNCVISLKKYKDLAHSGKEFKCKGRVNVIY